MSRSVNKVTLIGNVGNDPEIRSTSSGSPVAKVSLATNRQFQDRTGQTQDRTEWHRLTFFGRLAEIVEQYVSKGDPLYVEGRLEYSQTQDDKGNTRYWTDIVVNEMVMLGSASRSEDSSGFGGDREAAAQDGGAAASPPLTQPDDDLPF